MLFLRAVYIVHGSQPSCSEDWTLLGDSKCVSAIRKPTTFVFASQLCADDDAQVVSITSDEEAQLLKQLFPFLKSFWAHNNAEKETQEDEEEAGTATGHPAMNGGDLCSKINIADYEWEQVRCRLKAQ